MDETLGKVTALPVKSRAPRDDQALRPVDPVGRCLHWNTTFEVDVDGGTCKCLGCGQHVTPMFVLEQLMKEESRWHRARASYQDEMKRLSERSRTKCQHCGGMTRVSRR